MKCKFSLLLFLFVLSLWGQAQSLNLQELVNKKQFQEVVARADSLTPADSADYATMSAIGQAYEGLLRRFSYHFSQLSLTEKIIFNLRRKAKEAEDEDDDE